MPADQGVNRRVQGIGGVRVLRQKPAKTALILIFTIVSFQVLSAMNRVQCQEEQGEEYLLPDKVYTFSGGNNVKWFNVTFEEGYMYYVYVELVTYKELVMTIRITDPKGRQFKIFDSEMYPKAPGNSFEIPFGTSLAGKHEITFSTNLPEGESANLYISMSKGTECLHNAIPSSQLGEEKGFHVDTFQTKTTISYPVNLSGDTMHVGYVSRVSAINESGNADVSVDVIITSEGHSFPVFNQEPIEKVEEAVSYTFGTNWAGTYVIELTVYCQVDHVNIASILLEDFDISDEVHVNQTGATNTTSGNSTLASETFVPPVATYITAGTVGTLAVGTLLVMRRQKKEKVKLKD